MNNTQFNQVVELIEQRFDRIEQRLNHLEQGSSKLSNGLPELIVSKDVKANAVEVREYYMIYRPADLENYRKFITYLLVNRQELYLSEKTIDVVKSANKTFKTDIRISDKVYDTLDTLYQRIYNHSWPFDWRKLMMFKDHFDNITWEYM